MPTQIEFYARWAFYIVYWIFLVVIGPHAQFLRLAFFIPDPQAQVCKVLFPLTTINMGLYGYIWVTRLKGDLQKKILRHTGCSRLQ